MKNLYLFPVIILLLGFSCEKNETQPNKNGCIEGKLIQQWCAGDNLGVVKILSDVNLGEEWSKSLKKYENVVLALLDSVLLKYGKDWNRVIGSKDSIFYFTYDLKTQEPFSMCEYCCPPNKTVLVTSFSSNPCSTDK